MRTPTYELKIAASTSMGRPAYWHDTRRTHTYNVNTDLIKDNVVLVDEIKGKNIDEYIDELMQPSIDEYNAKQKRKDRRIEMSYTDWHKLNDNKGEMVYEFVMQFGEHEDLGKMYYDEIDEEKKNELRKQFIDTYTKWKDDWQKQHPNQKILWAVIHFDENGGDGNANDSRKRVGGTPHLHLAVTPISHEFKRGPKCQISMSKSLESDGFNRKDERKDGYQLERAFKKFREIQERDLIEMGYEIKPENGRKHLEPEAYRQIMEEADQKLEEAKEKATSITYFIDKVKQIEDAEKKLVDEKETGLIKTTYKDSPFAKPRRVAILPEEIYDSQEARRDIAHAKDDVKRVGDKVMKKVEDTINSIELSRKVEDEREIERLKEVIKEKDKVIDQQQKTINKLEQAADCFREFLNTFNIVQQWKDFWTRKKQEREWARTKNQEQEVERIH